ncbi:MAG TPA: cell wall hydrolase, partial [Novosphingobium sp.]|nr:cell wall hydrolase [Novosphingobium sp.]
ATALAQAEPVNLLPQAGATSAAQEQTLSGQPEAHDDASASEDLASLVAEAPQADALPKELNCLASAVYYEARNETLSGQLAVARVIVARSHSGRFPASYCGVVFQHGQFSFVHNGNLPETSHASHAWRNAAAIAAIADKGSWDSPVEGALYFHARRVSPPWHRERIARVDNHVFYR